MKYSLRSLMIVVALGPPLLRLMSAVKPTRWTSLEGPPCVVVLTASEGMGSPLVSHFSAVKSKGKSKGSGFNIKAPKAARPAGWEVKQG